MEYIVIGILIAIGFWFAPVILAFLATVAIMVIGGILLFVKAIFGQK